MKTEIKIIDNWKQGKTFKIYTKLDHLPFPILHLSSPIQLFGLSYGKDGSLYIIHGAKADSVLYERYEEGVKNLSINVPCNDSTNLKTSLHGSGQVVGVERDLDKSQRAHLGFSLRDINQMHLLAKIKIGTAGNYIGRLEQSKEPDNRSIVISGLFEIVETPVFSIWAAEGKIICPENTILVATTQNLNTNKVINIFVSLNFEKGKERIADTHQIVFITK